MKDKITNFEFITKFSNDLGVDFFAKYLPLLMLDWALNIDEIQLENVREEHSKTKRKIGNVIYYINYSLSKIKSGLGRPANDDLEEIVYLLRGVL